MSNCSLADFTMGVPRGSGRRTGTPSSSFPGGSPGGSDQFEGGDFYMATSGDFLMAADTRRQVAAGPQSRRCRRARAQGATAGALRYEVAGHIEDDLGGGSGGRGVGDRESARATQSNRDAVGPVIAKGEVERRAGRVVHRSRADVQIAEGGLLRDGQVAGHRRGVAWNSTMAGHPERPGDM